MATYIDSDCDQLCSTVEWCVEHECHCLLLDYVHKGNIDGIRRFLDTLTKMGCNNMSKKQREVYDTTLIEFIPPDDTIGEFFCSINALRKLGIKHNMLESEIETRLHVFNATKCSCRYSEILCRRCVCLEDDLDSLEKLNDTIYKIKDGLPWKIYCAFEEYNYEDHISCDKSK